LKILSRITEPDCGRAVLRGRVASLLEVGTGFHPELTGRENIYLYASILGFAPYFDQPFYVGFNVGGYELGLQPSEAEPANKAGGVVAYWGVNDAAAALSHLIEKGATLHEDVQDVGQLVLAGRQATVDEQIAAAAGGRGRAARDSDSEEGAQTINRNNLVIAPLNSVTRRFDDNMSWLKDEIDGIYIKVKPGTDSIETEGVVRAILASTHKDAGDFTVLVPAGLLKQKQATNQIFAFVMICIAGISLLVGGIGIMNIMLATVLERTREIGIRRAIGARQGDIVRQFLTEAVMISFLGGLMGIGFGVGLSRIISMQAGYATVVTGSSIGVAFGVSVLIGLLFGIYPAVQAAKLDPIEAIRYE
jgi:putative ABC transport system permease protein